MRTRKRSRSLVPGSSVLSGTRENPILVSGDENEEASEASQTRNPASFTTGDCRYCYGPEEASGTDPIIKVGCQCKGDNSNGHESCLKKWFKDKLLKSLNLDCELCKGPLGAHLKSILLTRNLPERAPGRGGAPIVLLLLQVPLEDLDRLQVPMNTPAFATLPRHTQLAIETSFQRQEEKHRGEELRRGCIHHADVAAALHGEGPRRADRLQARVARAAELREQFIAMVSVTRVPDGGAERLQAFFPRGGGPAGGDMNIKIVLQGEGCFCNARGEILRVPAPAGTQAPVVEELLEDLTLHSDVIAGEEALIMLPRCMSVKKLYTDWALNNIADGPGPSAQQVGPPDRRQITYGRYQRFFLYEVSEDLCNFFRPERLIEVL